MRTFILFISYLCSNIVLFALYPQDFESPIEVIAFGSCNKQNKEQPLWDVILTNNPDLWIWMGDNIYADTKDMNVMRSKYNQQFDQDSYKNFRKQIPVIGTWDDHDYGVNNGGKWYSKKKEAQALALDFFEEPIDSKRREQNGLYTSFGFGNGKQKIKIILLDLRYFMEKQGKNAHLMGQKQFRWLKEELLQSDARLNIIVSGIQFLPRDHRFEKWNNFPTDRKELLDFIRIHKIPGVVFLSGDRHIHEISIKNDTETNYPLHEITSSGLTHSYSGFKAEINRFRSGEVFPGIGFGLLTIDWSLDDPLVRLIIKNKANQTQNIVQFALSIVE